MEYYMKKVDELSKVTFPFISLCFATMSSRCVKRTVFYFI